MSQDHETFSTGNAASKLLASPLQFVKGIGPVKAGLMARLGLNTIQDLLFFFPTAHKDRASVTPIRQLVVGKEANIVVQIIDVKSNRFNGKEQIKAYLMDAAGDQIQAVWWNPWIADKLKPNAWGFFSGKVTSFGSQRNFSNAEFELFDQEEFDPKDGASATGPSFGRIVPIYNMRPKSRLPDGQEPPEIRLNQNLMRKVIYEALAAGAAEQIQDQLPETMRNQYKLIPLAQALHQYHFPENMTAVEFARRRLVFEELFIVSIGVALRRVKNEQAANSPRLPLAATIHKRIEARLPFQLTAAQKLAFEHISRDMSRPVPMNRLLQGDVGSGKTAVAVSALLLCVAHGHQAVLLAPTEALATQHHRTLKKLLENSRVEIGLLRGGVPASSKQAFLEKLKNGEIHIAIGTHALLEDNVVFKSLALAVVDEQHKFGVAQRMAMRAKGRSPHVLVMTATPIPRTMTLTLYGDLDVSVLNESPPGRGEVVTKWLDESERPKAFKLILEEAKKGHSTYIVLPRIKGEYFAENEAGNDAPDFSLVDANYQEAPKKVSRKKAAKPARLPTTFWNDFKGAEEEFKRIKEHLPMLKVELLHGQLKSDEKQRVLEALAAGKVDVLVSTQVIEVGIDLPTATVMLIENAELFGLSALHQLRGRVGRSERKSYCLFFSATNTDEGEERLRAFEKTRDGFEIAETDFRLRGPGQFFGTKQSGMPELKVADLLKDAVILAEAREAAFQIVREDPKLGKSVHAGLRKRVKEVLAGRMELVDVG